MATDVIPAQDCIYVVADRPEINRIAHGFFWYIKESAQRHADELNKTHIGTRVYMDGTLTPITFKVYKLQISMMEEA